MNSLRSALLAALSGLTVAVSAAPARALVIAPSPVPVRVATSEVVAVGKVVRIEDKTVVAPRFPGDTMPQEYQVAVLQISDGISGTAGKKEVRIGFLPVTNPGVGIRPIRGVRPVTFEAGEEVLVFLQPHFQAPFLTAPMYFSAVRKADPTFEKDVAEARRCAKLLETPNVSLMAKSEEDRFLTAAMLLARYRARPQFATEVKEEAIDAGQSQRILEILAEADWSAVGRQQFMLQPQFLFNQLGDKPGFTQPMDAREFEAAARKWLKSNAGTYVIKRFVAEPQK